MDRRKFLSRLTTTTAGIAVAAEVANGAATSKETRRVTYQVKGYTCVTCAVGLEVMLRGLKGVTKANASYPQNNVIIGFDEHTTNEKTLKQFISVCGFTVV